MQIIFKEKNPIFLLPNKWMMDFIFKAILFNIKMKIIEIIIYKLIVCIIFLVVLIFIIVIVKYVRHSSINFIYLNYDFEEIFQCLFNTYKQREKSVCLSCKRLPSDVTYIVTKIYIRLALVGDYKRRQST